VTSKSTSVGIDIIYVIIIEPELIKPLKFKSSIIALDVGEGVMEGVLVIVGVIDGEGKIAFTSYVSL